MRFRGGVVKLTPHRLFAAYGENTIMFGSNLLDIAIGLILTYLFLSLAVTAINELIAALSRARARDLERGIRNLLDGRSNLPERWWEPFIARLRFTRPSTIREGSPFDDEESNSTWWEQVVGRRLRGKEKPRAGVWSDSFFDHQLIYGLSKDGEKPSYVPAQTFAIVLLQMVQSAADSDSKLADKNAAQSPKPSPAHGPGGLPTFDELQAAIERINNPRIKEALLSLLAEARSNVTEGTTAIKKLADQVEAWFNHAMDRVGGWYKRRTQGFLFAIALLLTAFLNVDTVEISQSLAANDVLRQALVQSAQDLVALPEQESRRSTGGSEENVSNDAGISAALDHAQRRIKEFAGLGIPLGWNLETPATWRENLTAIKGKLTLTKILGLLLTAMAVSLGAPFWFDTLKKLVSVRSAGKAPEETPQPPKEVPQPQTPGGTPERKR